MPWTRRRAEGRRAFYTTPLKALSNQKLVELSAVYGPANVGLLTGDVSIRAGAPVVVMTTEVLRNMLYAEQRAARPGGAGGARRGALPAGPVPRLGVGGDPHRHPAPGALRVPVGDGVERGRARRLAPDGAGPDHRDHRTRRPVELEHHIALADRRRLQVRLAPLLHRGRPSDEAAALDASQVPRRAAGPVARTACRGAPTSWRRCRARAMLPAIVFIFSRAACDDAVAQCVHDGLRLTTPEQHAEIRRVCERRTDGISDDELRALDYGVWSHALEQGVAAHHAGMAPAIREAVEECFAAGLLQVVYATETLALGVNMPARSVVIERLMKVREHGRSGLTSGEYAQLTGHAGVAASTWSAMPSRCGRPTCTPGSWPDWRRRPPPSCGRASAPTTTWPSTWCGASPAPPPTACSTSRSRSSRAAGADPPSGRGSTACWGCWSGGATSTWRDGA